MWFQGANFRIGPWYEDKKKRMLKTGEKTTMRQRWQMIITRGAFKSVYGIIGLQFSYIYTSSRYYVPFIVED
jgi:hypothetical protein